MYTGKLDYIHGGNGFSSFLYRCPRLSLEPCLSHMVDPLHWHTHSQWPHQRQLCTWLNTQPHLRALLSRGRHTSSIASSSLLLPPASGMKVLWARPHSDTHYSGIDGLPPPCYSVKIRKQRPFLGKGMGFVSILCVTAESIINSGSQSNMTW